MTHQHDILHASTDLRRRHVANKPDIPHDKHTPQQLIPSKEPTNPKLRPASSFSTLVPLVAILILSFSLMPAVHLWGQYRIQTLNHIQPTPENPFIYENAMRHIRTLGAKPKWVGSQALEDAMQYLLAELSSFKPEAEKHGLELEVELFRSGPGSFLVDIANIDLYSTYDNISSVVARLRPSHMPADTPEKSLLLAAHVDSAASSPGANDNVAGVAVIVEVLRAIASSDVYDLKRPVVVLLNGAEETVLTGAHSFVKQHRWAPTIAAHLNMESIGSGDRYHLFRLGPHSPWLIEAYAKAVSFPVGTVTATDVFDLKVIPAETDFRVFSEFGNIPGFDFALVDNGYIYHTTQDSVDHVVPTGVHHGGRIIFELAMELAGPNDAIGMHFDESRSAPQGPLKRLNAALIKISNDLGLVRDPERPLSVFFDVLQLRTIAYQEGVAMLLNLSVIATTVLVWVSKFGTMGKSGFMSSLRMCLVLIGCLLGSFASATFASLVYAEVYDARLQWYGSWVKAWIMYTPPALFGIISAMLHLLPRRLSSARYDHMLFACTAFYMAITAFLMAYRAMSSYMPVLFMFAANICALWGDSANPVLRHFVLLTFNTLLAGGTIPSALSTMLPLLGRARSETVPHDTIAAVLVTYFSFVHVFLPCLPVLCYYAKALRQLRIALFFVSMGIAAWIMAAATASGRSSLREVYSTDAPKRFTVIHFHSPQHDPKSILFIGAMDPIQIDRERITSDILAKSIPFPPSSVDLPTWGILNSTAVETFRPFLLFVTEIALFETELPPDVSPPEVALVSETEVPDGWNVTFRVEGIDTHQLSVRFPIGRGSSVSAWSLDADIKESEGGAWIRHIGSESFEFWIVQRKVEGAKFRPKFCMVVTTCRLGYSRSSEVLEKLNFEAWESPSAISSVGIEVEL